ncbi:hypothetical protein CBL_05180 [Carabus blaptoides fortunei]
MNKDAEPVNIEEVTSTTFEKPKTRSLIINDEKQVVEVEEETNSSEISEHVTAKSDTETKESIKTPQEPVDHQIVITTTEISSNNHERADTNVQQLVNDLKWLQWTLFSVTIVCNHIIEQSDIADKFLTFNLLFASTVEVKRRLIVS